MAEEDLEWHLKSYPNFLDNRLLEMKDGFLNRDLSNGKAPPINVVLQQEVLPSGRLDLAFVTYDTVYLVELKWDVINEETLEQYYRYEPYLRQHYPGLSVRGFLIGRSCPKREEVQRLIGDAHITILLSGSYELPKPLSTIRCPKCRAGNLADYDDKCRRCAHPL
ncbi:hypothetical protein ACFL2Q_09910 [Thermodesulfobacteriota bacterium]